MKQSTSRRSNTESYLSTLFDDDEIFVSHILLDFSNLILLRELPNQFPATWFCKRKRSAFDSSHLKEEERQKEKKSKVKTYEALSPDTPFSFCPSESDENSKHSHKQISTKTENRESTLSATSARDPHGDKGNNSVSTDPEMMGQRKGMRKRMTNNQLRDYICN